MRLLFVHDRFGAMAGAEMNLQLTAAELQRRGHAIGIAHGKPTGKGEIEWQQLFPERFPLTDPDNFSAAQQALNVFQPDAVYVHKTADLGVLRALVQSRFPLVRMVHDHDLYCLRSYKYFPLTRRICTRAAGPYCVFPCGAVLARSRNGGLPVKWMSYKAKQAELRLNRSFQRMIVATDFMKQELIRNKFDPDRIEVHAPVPKHHDASPREPANGGNRIVYAGQLIRGKGVDVLIQCLAHVNVRFECIIAGEGNHRNYCEALARRLGLSDRVRFVGYLDPQELQRVYADATLAVVSSLWPEPFGAVGLEAMRHGLPVVAFDAGGIREWLRDGENGFLIPWMDRTQFASRVEQLLKNKDLARKLGRRGQEYTEQKFNFEQYISGLESMFDRVIAESQRRSRETVVQERS
jgi:glycosyltransferase involved in cell wall biosynthesis